MKRLGGLFLLAAMVYPAAAAAQKPSNSMHTRSAEVYLDRAKGASRPDERTDLLNKALEVLTEGMARDANNPKVWFLTGQVYTRLGDAAGADSAFDKAEAMYPDYRVETEPEREALWINLYNTAIASLQEGDEAKAIEQFEAADRIYRRRPEAILTLGSLYAVKGDMARAEAAYRATLEIIRSPAGESRDAEAKALAAEQEATAATRLADLLSQSGKAAESLAVLRTLVERQPDNAQAKSALAMALASAGQADEAGRLYQEVLAGDDLDDTALFNTGVGLYQAQQYDLAARAFSKALERNAMARDALYNLGQAQYAAAADLETERNGAPETEKPALNEKLTALYTELAATAGKLRALDPNQRNGFMMLAQAQRSLGELVSDPAAAAEWKQKVLATLEAAEALPFEVNGVELMPGDGRTLVKGSVTNLKLPAGESIALEFTLYDATGAELGTQQVTVQAPEPSSLASFEFEFVSGQPVAGWKYRVTG